MSEACCEQSLTCSGHPHSLASARHCPAQPPLAPRTGPRFRPRRGRGSHLHGCDGPSAFPHFDDHEDTPGESGPCLILSDKGRKQCHLIAMNSWGQRPGETPSSPEESVQKPPLCALHAPSRTLAPLPRTHTSPCASPPWAPWQPRPVVSPAWLPTLSPLQLEGLRGGQGSQHDSPCAALSWTCCRPPDGCVSVNSGTGRWD